MYGLFPFFIPEVTHQNLTKLGIVDKYDFARPVAQPIPKVLNTLTGIRYVFNDSTKFNQTYKADMELLTDGYGFMLTFDDYKRHETDKQLVWHALFPNKDAVDKSIQWYKEKTVAMLKQYSYSYDGVPGTYVDIIKNVVNLVSVHWAADKLVSALSPTNRILNKYTECFLLVLTVWYPAEDGRESEGSVHGAGGVRHVRRPLYLRVREHRPRTRLGAA